MPIAPKQDIEEIQIELVNFIENDEILDKFSLRRFLRVADSIGDMPTRLMIRGLAYGAAAQHDDAVDNFKRAVECHHTIAALNYLAYLGRTGNHRLHRDESIRIGRAFDDPRAYVRARNAAYADGDYELSLFFARKWLAAFGDSQPNARRMMEEEVNVRMNDLENFIEVTCLATAEITALSMLVANTAKEHGILAISHDYYTSTDKSEAALVCDVLCTDIKVLADLDIELATAIAMNETFNDKNVTAWYRGKTRDEVANKI